MNLDAKKGFRRKTENDNIFCLVSEKMSYRQNRKGSLFIQGLISSLEKNQNNNLNEIIKGILAEVLVIEENSPEEIRDFLRNLGGVKQMLFKYAEVSWKELRDGYT